MTVPRAEESQGLIVSQPRKADTSTAWQVSYSVQTRKAGACSLVRGGSAVLREKEKAMN